MNRNEQSRGVGRQLYVDLFGFLAQATHPKDTRISQYKANVMAISQAKQFPRLVIPEGVKHGKHSIKRGNCWIVDGGWNVEIHEDLFYMPMGPSAEWESVAVCPVIQSIDYVVYVE